MDPLGKTQGYIINKIDTAESRKTYLQSDARRTPQWSMLIRIDDTSSNWNLVERVMRSEREWALYCESSDGSRTAERGEQMMFSSGTDGAILRWLELRIRVKRGEQNHCSDYESRNPKCSDAVIHLTGIFDRFSLSHKQEWRDDTTQIFHKRSKTRTNLDF